MDLPLGIHSTDLAPPGEVSGAVVGDASIAGPTTMTPHVAETMRRVHAQLRDGMAPTYESLLALGAPTTP